ncbi:cytochrome c [Aliifodinibius sp. S!AR15-10]|uniref:c-type cytochrome n=1 Tax=Aliifodinibius sp. S!AR15-10 TaxID=2950437 RepID=UPI0028559BCB|nr:cytochrome c [Aliifodinibius sp. S!AR15-10]MDR8393184.1 cytochrome c [Aliifodinibius sp. S!AR15-10]
MRQQIATLIVSLALLVGCGGQGSGNQQQAGNQDAKDESGLTQFEITNGIGPITEAIEIGEIDSAKVEQGAQIFETKCSACHKMNERYVGPALGDILETRTPAYVMNMVLNPAEMVKKHPEAKKMLQEYMTPMPNQNLQQDEARAIVEYLASVENEEVSATQ